MDKKTFVSKIKSVYGNIRIAHIKPPGMWATRALVVILLVPIVLVIIQYAAAFAAGYVAEETAKLIDVGIKIIDHIFVPAVLTALVGFLALWLDKDNNGIPDRLENQQLPTCIQPRKDDREHEKGI